MGLIWNDLPTQGVKTPEVPPSKIGGKTKAKKEEVLREIGDKTNVWN